MMQIMRRAFLSLALLALALLAWWTVRSDAPDSARPGAVGGTGTAAANESGAPVGADLAEAPTTVEARTVIHAVETPRGTGALIVLVVTEPVDAPIPHVAVRAVARDGRDEESTQRVVVTDEDGRAPFDRLDAGPWVIATDRSVGGRAETAIEVLAGSETGLTIRVPAGVDAVVRVLDSDAVPVPGADVLHWPASGLLDAPAWEPGQVIGRTNARGELEVRALPNLQGHGSWFAATHPALGTSVARMVRSPTDGDDRAPRVVELTLGIGGAWIDLRVVDDAGHPVEGATASARPIGHPGSTDDEHTRVLLQTCRRERTAADGRAKLGPLSVGQHMVRVRAHGCVPYREAIRVEGDELVSRDIVLLPASRVQGVVIDRGGAAVAGVRVQIQLEPAGGSTQSGPDGRFSIAGLGAGQATWFAVHDDHQEASGDVELVAGEDRELSIVLEPLALLHGRVVDETGSGLAGWSVVAAADLPGYADDRRRGETDAEGVFQMPVRGDTDYVLDVAEPGQAFPPPIPDAGPVRARAEPWIVTVPDAARATAFVEGFLFDRDGSPAIEGRHLSMQRDGPLRVWFGRTGPAPRTDTATGHFRVGPLPPGRYVLWVWRPDRVQFPILDVELRPRQTTNLGRIEEPATGTIEAVLDADPDTTLGDVRVQLELRLGSDTVTDFLRVDRESLTASKPVFPGRYRATIFGDGFRSFARDVEVSAGESTTLRGTLRAAVQVGLRFHMPDGEQAATFEVRDARGEPALDVELEKGLAFEDWWPHLDRGRFTVHANGASGREYFAEFTVETLERREKPIDIRVRPAR